MIILIYFAGINYLVGYRSLTYVNFVIYISQDIIAIVNFKEIFNREAIYAFQSE